MYDSIKTAVANILIVVLCLGMVGAGMIKIMSLPDVVEVFQKWNIPDWARYGIGIYEFIIGLGIFIPKTRVWSLWGLIILMLGASTVHIYFGEYMDLRGPIMVIFAAFGVLFLQKK